jgi:maltose alpha-D-glucosyltransferase/alpha-amylase
MSIRKLIFSKLKYLAPVFLMVVNISCRQEKPRQKAQISPETWYNNALIYNLDVDAFQDSDGDGTGDFNGLTQRLGYLDSLGIDIIWLSPFQPTPDHDDGYDISDFYGIDPRLGSKADFDRFMQAAKSRGIHVIMDMVLNHTSIDHPWFQAARADTNSKFHDWYVWSAKKPKDWNEGMVFPGVQTETWTYDDITREYYFHRFYNFQPDLNYERADVRRMAVDVIQYWLKQGMDGFRLDAVPFIIDKPETGAKNPAHMFELLTQLTAAARKVKPDVVILGEANVTAEENADYFGQKGERLQMMFNFYANQYLFYSLAKKNPASFVRALEKFRDKPAACQWVFFLRNHDEIDLARLKDDERKLVYDQMGPETNMQLYNRGIRRRLAPMLANPGLIRMSYSLLFSLPGTQLIRYGEEIGMGDDLTLNERLSVRTPMQWDTTANAGFSTAVKTFRRVIPYGNYAYQKLNVKNQLANPGSLLNFIRDLIALRKKHPEIGLGNWETFTQRAESVMMIRYQFKGKALIAIHNFSPDEQEVSLEKVIPQGKVPKVIFSNDVNYSVHKISGYGFQWITY